MQDILEAIPDWIRFRSCPFHRVAPLVSGSLCNFIMRFFFPVLHLKYSLSREPNLEDRQFESMDASPVLVREEREGKQENLENYVFSVSFPSAGLFSLHSLFCC